MAFKFRTKLKGIARPIVLNHWKLDGSDIRNIIPKPADLSPEAQAGYEEDVKAENKRVKALIAARVVRLLSPTGPNEGALFLRGLSDEGVSRACRKVQHLTILTGWFREL